MAGICELPTAYTSHCARWLLRLPLGAEPDEKIPASVVPGYLLFRVEHSRGVGKRFHFRLTMKVMGHELCSMLASPPPDGAEGSNDPTLHVLLRSDHRHGYAMAIETLARLGCLLGLSAVPPLKGWHILPEDDEEGQQHSESVGGGSGRYALQVASLLAFAGQMMTWGGRENFPPSEAPYSLFNLLEEALLPTTWN
jgi:hypothetical protein